MMAWLRQSIFLFAWLVCAHGAAAHEIRPAYLQIEQTGANSYNVLWKVPSRSGRVLDIQPKFEDRLKLAKAGIETLLDGFVVYRYRLTGDRPLAGSRLTVRGLSQTTVDALVNIRMLDGDIHTYVLRPTANAFVIPAAATKWNVLTTYTALGIRHILHGIDHLLFVLALLLLAKGFWRVIKTITAFTVAHSITLSLAVLGVVNVPGPPVEAVIALSIVFLALEIVRAQNGEETLTGRKPWLVAFTFGLLHGLGFAGALTEIGLPRSEIPLALASFNIGVELGQIAFVCLALLVISALNWLGARRTWPRALYKATPYFIGAVSMFWVLERVSNFVVSS